MTDKTLIIRPQPDADRDVACLARFQVPAAAIPVMQGITMRITWPDPGQFQGIVLTSRHAVNRLHASPDVAAWRNLPVFAVGNATAAAALAAVLATFLQGKVMERFGAGHCGLFWQHVYNQSATLVWPRAADIGFDMVAALAPHGIRLDPVVVYQMVPRSDLTDSIQAALQSSKRRAGRDVGAVGQSVAGRFRHGWSWS